MIYVTVGLAVALLLETGGTLLAVWKIVGRHIDQVERLETKLMSLSNPVALSQAKAYEEPMPRNPVYVDEDKEIDLDGEEEKFPTVPTGDDASGF